jgi:SAM-dependent methyltransferase
MTYGKTGKYVRRTTCRGCMGTNLHSFLDYGSVPLAGDFIQPEDVGCERLYPMDLVVCRDCSLVQIVNVVDARELFTDYRYLSSVTSTLTKHFAEYAQTIRDRILGSTDGLVVEFGCNDGVLLSPLQKLGIRAIGIDAADNVVELAKCKGLDVRHGFFGPDTAETLRSTYGPADVVTGSNVFAHIDDLDQVLRGVQVLLAHDGTFIVEVHYVVDLLDKFQFDTVYHEHLCYYSVHALAHLLGRFGLRIVDVERLPMHGGAIRVLARRREATNASPTPAVESLLRLEARLGLDTLDPYRQFGETVLTYRRRLQEFVLGRKQAGRSISGYGAAGRATILLNFCGFDAQVLDYVVDESPSRVGRYIPGVQIPVVPREHFRAQPTDDCLLTAWNYREEIVGKEQDYLRRGGCFLTPLPELQVLQGDQRWRNAA